MKELQCVIVLLLLLLLFVVSVATSTKDPLAVDLFHTAGVQLGRHVKALVPQADKVESYEMI